MHDIWMYLEKSFDVVYVIISQKALFVDMISQKVTVHKFSCSKKKHIDHTDDLENLQCTNLAATKYHSVFRSSFNDFFLTLNVKICKHLRHPSCIYSYYPFILHLF